MSRRKKHLTKEEHIKVAEAIYDLIDLYSGIQALFIEEYGVTHHYTKLLHKGKYEQLKGELDCEFFNSHYHTSNSKYVSPYYSRGYQSYKKELSCEGKQC